MPKLSRSRGRPPINDWLPLYVLTEAGRRRSERSLLAHCRDRRIRMVDCSIANEHVNIRVLKGEALRRRFNAAPEKLGLTRELHPHVSIPVEEHDKIFLERAIVERMIKELLEN